METKSQINTLEIQPNTKYLFFGIVLLGMLSLIILGVVFAEDKVEILNSDSTKIYDDKTQTVIIKDINEKDAATIRLISDLNNKVGIGYQKVAEYEVTSLEALKILVSNIEFYDMNEGMESINRMIDYKIKGTEQVEVNDYKLVCKEVWSEENKTNQEECSNVISGTHLEDRDVWNDLNKVDYLKDEKIIVGLFTNTKEGDYIEWIPTFEIEGQEFRIEEWAYWTAGLNVDLVAYYKLDGDIMEEVNNYNGVNHSAVYSTYAKINEALVGGYVQIADNNDFDFSGAFSISVWINSSGNDVTIIAKQYGDVTSANLWFLDYGQAANGIRFYQYDATGIVVGSTADDLDDGEYHHLVITRDGSDDWVLYVDNVSRDTANHGQDYTSTDVLEFHARSNGEVVYTFGSDEVGLWKGRALSVEEVSLLFEAPPYGDYGPSAPDCQFNGTVKDGDGTAINGAKVVIVYTGTDILYGNTTSDASGLWDLNVSVDGNFTVYAYEVDNITRAGDIFPYVECIRV